MQKSRVIEYVCSMQTKCEIKYIPTLFLTGKTIFQFDYFLPFATVGTPCPRTDFSTKLTASLDSDLSPEQRIIEFKI